ncbi:MAG: TlpA family protein disulfide reductase [Acidobacteria bacterium]|nr:TlpA family protein disulfide reductase [Acidobacteriota bacterium]
MRVATLGPGTKAPDFTLTGLDGKKYSLAQALAQGPVLLAFFKESCPVCQFALPFIERIHRGGNSQGGIHIWGVSQDDQRDSRAFAREYGLSFPVLLDESGYPVSNAYGLTNVPTLFLVEPDGQIALTSIGFNKAEIESVAHRMGQRVGKKLVAFPPGENVPDYKPG